MVVWVLSFSTCWMAGGPTHYTLVPPNAVLLGFKAIHHFIQRFYMKPSSSSALRGFTVFYCKSSILFEEKISGHVTILGHRTCLFVWGGVHSVWHIGAFSIINVGGGRHHNIPLSRGPKNLNSPLGLDERLIYQLSTTFGTKVEALC